MSGKSDRKLKNILLEPKVQLRYMYYLMAIALTPLVALMSFTLLELYKVKTILDLDSQIPNDVRELIQYTLGRVSVGFFIGLIGTGAAILYATLAVSHRFLGPIYVINLYLESLLKNEPFRDRELRKQDELKETWRLLRELGDKYLILVKN